MRTKPCRLESGFSLIELLVSVAILTIISGAALEGMFRLSKVSQTVSNRVEMHSGVRNATELLQQEVGQAGRVALPHLVQLGAALTNSDATGAVPITVKVVDAAGNAVANANGTDGMFSGEKLVVDSGSNQETVTVTLVDTGNKAFTADFKLDHAANAPVNVFGGFRYGVIPKTNKDGSAFINGSTGSLMKIIGDINSDGNLEYVEYKCDTASGNLYRRTMDYMAGSKPPFTADMSLLSNITKNPDNSDCFTYQQVYGQDDKPFVVDVAITLTVRTPEKDPVTGLYQTETKALLNVSPRNVFNTSLLAGQYPNRVQELPPNVDTLRGLP